MFRPMFNRAIARSFLPLLSIAERQPKDAESMQAAQGRILTKVITALAQLPVGRRFGLDRLPLDQRLAEAFARQQPVTSYGDYQELIDRVAAGERDVLFEGPALALAQTSGTTSSGQAGERYIPQNPALLHHHARGGAAA